MSNSINWKIWIIVTFSIILAVELIIYLFTGSIKVTFESLGGVAAAAALISTIYYYSKQIDILKREVDEISKKAEISFDGLLFNYFTYSVRVFLKVKNKETVSATNAMCFIHIENMGKLRDYLIPKNYNNREIVNEINNVLKNDSCMWDPIINSYDRFREVNYEPVSWNVWLDTGSGIERMQFKYLTIIPANGMSLAELMDIYLCEHNNEKFYVLRVFSEYGPEQKPKVIFKLPIGGDAKIKIDVMATGDRVKDIAKGEVIIRPTDDKKDYQIEFNNSQYKFAKFFMPSGNEPHAKIVKC
ncbi:MAG: hypothetical protein QXY87_14210 [Saccharolobus sp.]|uniref:hypothetical protein n=1 Tax=Saccharolobus sp. TaxID=2100761 RepID=UPI002411F25D|nr:hypothetical protein [Candidatus Rehaiarchaeum fermentans]